MRHFLSLLAVALALSAPLTSLRAATEPANAPVPTFDQARDSAARDNKLLLIIFSGDWDPDCARLDQSTLADGKVAAVLRERAVSVHIDVLTAPELTAKYHVRDVPLMVLVKPDGTEVDRWLGFQSADRFAQEFASTLAGHPTLERLRAEVKPAEPQTRQNLCATLIGRGSYSDAVTELRRLYEQLEFSTEKKRMQKNQNLLGHIQVIRRLGSLREAYPPAGDFLRAKRTAHAAEVSADPTDTNHAQRVASIDWSLGQSDDTLAFFHSLPKKCPAHTSLKKPVFDILVKNRIYAEAATLFSSTEHAHEIERLSVGLGMPIMQIVYGVIHAMFPLQGGEIIALMHKSFTQRWARQLEPFVGIQDRVSARQIAEVILKCDRSEEGAAIITASAKRALGDQADGFLRSLELPGLPPAEKPGSVRSDDEPATIAAPFEEDPQVIRLEPFVVTTRTTGCIPLSLGLPAKSLKQKITHHVTVSTPSTITTESLMPFRKGVLLVAINGKSIKGRTWKSLGDFWLEGGEAGDQVVLVLKGKGSDDCVYHQVTVKRVRPAALEKK